MRARSWASEACTTAGLGLDRVPVGCGEGDGTGKRVSLGRERVFGKEGEDALLGRNKGWAGETETGPRGNGPTEGRKRERKGKGEEKEEWADFWVGLKARGRKRKAF